MYCTIFPSVTILLRAKLFFFSSHAPYTGGFGGSVARPSPAPHLTMRGGGTPRRFLKWHGSRRAWSLYTELSWMHVMFLYRHLIIIWRNNYNSCILLMVLVVWDVNDLTWRYWWTKTNWLGCVACCRLCLWQCVSLICSMELMNAEKAR